MYSQFSRKQLPLVHKKVVAYERWSLTGTIKEISPKLYQPIDNNNYYYRKLLPLLVKIRQIDKAIAIKTNSFWVLQHILCFVYALMNLVAFESGNVLLVKSTEAGQTVFFQLCKLLLSVRAIAKLNFWGI